MQAIKEVHDRERDRLLRGQQELQQHVYGQQLGVSIAYCKTSTPTPIRYKILVRTACYCSNCLCYWTSHLWPHSGNDLYQVPSFKLLLAMCQKHPVCPFPISFSVFLFLFSHLSSLSIIFSKSSLLLKWPKYFSFHFFIKSSNHYFIFHFEFLPNWLISLCALLASDIKVQSISDSSWDGLKLLRYVFWMSVASLVSLLTL